MLDKNSKLIYKFLDNNYGKAIFKNIYYDYCEKHKISKKESIEIYQQLLFEKSVVERDNDSFVPLRYAKVIYSLHKQTVNNKWHPIIISVITSIIISSLTTILTIYLTNKP